MRRFDNKGMMLIPAPIESENVKSGNVLVATNIFCPNGHSLICDRAVFNSHPGILLNVSQGDKKGSMVISPIFGDKSRICLDFDLIDGKALQMFCPTCNVEIPVHSPCDSCHKGQLRALFLTPEGNFNDCIAVCDTVGCSKANIISSGELIAISRLEIT